MNSSETQAAPRFTGIATFFRTESRPSETDWKNVDIGCVGVPFDGGSTNRPGARFGPREVRNQSTLIAPWNPAMRINPFAVRRIADIGDVWVRRPFQKIEDCLSEIGESFQRLVERNVTPVSVGGDHAISLPVLRALGSSEPVAMIHIDAHCDTGDGYMGSKYHHGAPFSRAVEEGVLDPKHTVQIGIRGPLNNDDIWRFSGESGMRVISMDEFCDVGLAEVIREARQIVGTRRCYLSFDIDALDPAFAPGTGTPVVGGITSREAIRLVRGLRGLNFIGADLVEVSPPFDTAGATALAGATLLFEMLCIVAEGQPFEGCSKERGLL